MFLNGHCPEECLTTFPMIVLEAPSCQIGGKFYMLKSLNL